MSKIKVGQNAYTEYETTKNWSKKYAEREIEKHREASSLDHADGSVEMKHLSQTVVDLIGKPSKEVSEEVKAILDGKMDGWQVLPLSADLDNLEDGFYYVGSDSEVATVSETAYPPCLIIQKTSYGYWQTQIKIGTVGNDDLYIRTRETGCSWANWTSYAKKRDIPSVTNSLTSTSTTSALSANQGKVLKDSIGELIPFKHTQYGELTRTLQEQIGNINYMTNKGDSCNNLVAGLNGLNDSLSSSIAEVLSKVTTLESKHTSDVSALQSAIDGISNVDSGGGSVAFGVKKLGEGDVFSVKANMLCLVLAGDEVCVQYGYDSPLDNMGTGFVFATDTNYDVEKDWASSEETYSGYCRVAMGYKTKSSSLSIPFTTKNWLVPNLSLRNDSSDINVYVFYIKQE